MKNKTDTAEAPPPAKPASKAVNEVNKLLAQLSEVDVEITRHKKMSGDAASQRDELFKVTDLGNAAEFEKVNALSRKLEMIPGRIRAFEQKRAELTAALKEANQDIEAELSNILRTKLETLEGRIAAAVACWYDADDETTDAGLCAVQEHDTGLMSARRVAETRVAYSKPGHVLVNQLSWLRNGNYKDRLPVAKAAELLRMIEEAAAVTV